MKIIELMYLKEFEQRNYEQDTEASRTEAQAGGMCQVRTHKQKDLRSILEPLPSSQVFVIPALGQWTQVDTGGSLGLPGLLASMNCEFQVKTGDVVSKWRVTEEDTKGSLSMLVHICTLLL